MKTRTRKKPPPVTHVTAVIHRHEVETLGLVQIETIDDVERAEVEGRLVKLAPTVRASEKAAFDGRALVARLRERGALGVVLAPRMVPDTKQSREEIETMDPRELVDAWFADQKSIPEKTRAAALEIVLETMETEGL